MVPYCNFVILVLCFIRHSAPTVCLAYQHVLWTDKPLERLLLFLSNYNVHVLAYIALHCRNFFNTTVEQVKIKNNDVKQLRTCEVDWEKNRYYNSVHGITVLTESHGACYTSNILVCANLSQDLIKEKYIYLMANQGNISVEIMCCCICNAGQRSPH